MRLIAILGALALATPATAQGVCMPRDVAQRGLAGEFGELRQSGGITHNGKAVFEMYGNAETGTWTMLVTTPDGVSCFVASGSGYVGAIIPGDPA
jgi:hypothetical protein